MSEKKIVEFEKGEFGVDLELVEGKLRLKTGVDSKGADAHLIVDLEIDYFLDKLAAVIPGEIDDSVIAIVKAALKSA